MPLSDTKTYPLYLSIYFKLVVFVPLSLFTIGGLFIALGPAIAFRDDGPQWFFGIF